MSPFQSAAALGPGLLCPRCAVALTPDPTFLAARAKHLRSTTTRGHSPLGQCIFDERRWRPLQLPAFGANGDAVLILDDVPEFARLRRRHGRREADSVDLPVALEGRYGQFLDTVPDAMIVVGARGIISLVNAHAEVLFGYERSELVGRHFSSLIPGLRRAPGGQLLPVLSDTAGVARGSALDHLAIRKDGTPLPIELTLGVLHTERGTTTSVAIRDIRGRSGKRCEAQLLADRLADAVESIQDAFALFDNDDRLILCNTGYRRLVAGCLSGVVIGKSYEQLLDAWIVVVPDRARRTPAVDPDDHHLFISLGAAVENLAIAARARGFRAAATLDAGHRLTLDLEEAPREDTPLFRAIPLRQSTRADFDGRPVSAPDLRLLQDAAAVPGVDLAMLTDTAALERVLELVLAGNATQMADPAFKRELKAWIRFNPRAAMQSGDGLFSGTTGNPTVPSWLGRGCFDLLFRLDRENAKYTRQVRSSAGIAVFLGDRADPARWIDVGRSCQRSALQATALGLRCSFINQPVEVAALRPALAGLVGAPNRRPDLVLRFGHGPTLPYSLRRPVEAVIERA